MRHRRERAGAADLHFDVFDDRLFLMRREFERDGPARGFGGPAKLALLADGVHFHHHAVDLIGERTALGFPIAVEIEHVVQSRRISCDASSP